MNIRYSDYKIFAPRLGTGHKRVLKTNYSGEGDLFYLWDEEDVFEAPTLRESLGAFATSLFVQSHATPEQFDNTILTYRSDKIDRYIAIYHESEPDLIDAISQILEEDGGERTPDKAKLLMFLSNLDMHILTISNHLGINEFYDTSTSDHILRKADNSLKAPEIKEDFIHKIHDKIYGVLSRYNLGTASKIDDIDFVYLNGESVSDFSMPDIVEKLGMDTLWDEGFLLEHAVYKRQVYKAVEPFTSVDDSYLNPSRNTSSGLDTSAYDHLFE